jgi:hypothetical protein
MQVMPAEDGAVIFVSTGAWLPDTNGFNPIDTTPHLGVLVLAERAAAFLQWSSQENRYRIVLGAPYPR